MDPTDRKIKADYQLDQPPGPPNPGLNTLSAMEEAIAQQLSEQLNAQPFFSCVQVLAAILEKHELSPSQIDKIVTVITTPNSTTSKTHNLGTTTLGCALPTLTIKFCGDESISLTLAEFIKLCLHKTAFFSNIANPGFT